MTVKVLQHWALEGIFLNESDKSVSLKRIGLVGSSFTIFNFKPKQFTA
jgi:hypothetical protein